VEGQPVLLRDGSGQEHRAVVRADGTVTVNGLDLRVHKADDGSLVVEAARHRMIWAVVSGEVVWVFLDGEVFTFEIEQDVRRRRRSTGQHESLTAPMPATVRKVGVSAGDAVLRGDVLIVLEAMKMELPVRAHVDGVVTTVHCREGDLVQPGVRLIELGS
jgi:acetyl/propionyl-CoA carboxylase alpha subunit